MKSDATTCESRDILSRRWLVFTQYWLPAIAMLAVGPLAISNALSTSHGVIALWLGHESIETTQVYLEATLTMKEQALARTAPLNGTPSRYRPDDQLLAFLNRL